MGWNESMRSGSWSIASNLLLVTVKIMRWVKDPIDDGKSVSWLLETFNELRLVKDPIDDGK